MSLSSCTKVFGETVLIAADPEVASDTDCVYQPFDRSIFFDRDPSWGLYSLDGRLVPAAAYTRGSNDHLVGQSERLDIDHASLEIIEEEHIYFGPLIPHYGHFIVTSLARAWFLDNTASKQRLLCHSDQKATVHFSGSYMGDAIGALGLDATCFTMPQVATRFKNLTIPCRAFIEQKIAHRAFLAPMHTIGDAFLSSRHREKQKRPVYLSKSRLPHGSVSRITNEHEIEARISEFGVEIVYPETLSLAEQVQLFSSRQTILGFAGSAFHTHVFVRAPPRMFVCTLDDHVNSNFPLLDELNQAQSCYLHPNEGMRQEEAIGFSVARSIRDVPQFVAELLEAASIASCFYRSGGGLLSQASKEVGLMYNETCVPDHGGDNYISVLARLHEELNPSTYLEIGTLHGATLSLASCRSVAVDPNFQIKDDIVGRKPTCLMFQTASDEFFAQHDPTILLGKKIDFAFLDGMHRCEYLLRDFINVERHCAPGAVIALHDCLPVEIPMTSRIQGDSDAVIPHRAGWWTGDVWRTVLALKKNRPDLHLVCLDAAPTGLVLVSRLNPASRALEQMYDQIVEDMMLMDLQEMTVTAFLAEVGLKETSHFASNDSYREHFLTCVPV